MTVPERIEGLRSAMRNSGVDVYVVPSADFHQSEYVGEYFKAREYITGFNGSAGTAIITLNDARLWTDGRYFIQAASQLKDTGIELMKIGEPDYPTISEYLDTVLSEGKAIGLDGRVISVEEGKAYEFIAKKNGAKLISDIDLISEIWNDRPCLPTAPVFELGLKYTGESTASKLERIRKEMKALGADEHILTSIDDICWILNIRGNDIEFFPLVLTYSIIKMDEMLLYIDEHKLDSKLKARLLKDNIKLQPYNTIYEDIKNIPDTSDVLIDTDRLNYAIYNSIPARVNKLEGMNPSILMKAAKNEVEIANIRKAQLKDSIAHVKFMKWLKENFGSIEMDELSVEAKLEEFRKEQGNYIGPSFDPISAYGEHAAIVHYSPTDKTNAKLEAGSFLLIDSGAGYLEGSTDITRTYALGEVPAKLKEHFTTVAIGNLTLAAARFPEGTVGANLDILARKPFWDRGLNYNHGTGHGVGYLLSIHEPPVSINYSIRRRGNTPLMEGLVVTDEPGVYIEGSHGVRLENELLCCKGAKNECGQFMYFDILTFVPFDLDAIDPSMLHDEERRLLNEYHRQVFEMVSPHLDAAEKEWLREYTREL